MCTKTAKERDVCEIKYGNFLDFLPTLLTSPSPPLVTGSPPQETPPSHSRYSNMAALTG